MESGQKVAVATILPVTHREVLSCIAYNGSSNMWEISNITHRSYPGIHKAVKKLLFLELITVERIEPGQRNPNIEVKYYDLTKVGLFNSLLMDRTWDEIDRVAEFHEGKLPLIFGKWSFFRERGILDEVKRRLYLGLLSGYSILSRVSLKEYLKFESEQDDDLKEFKKVSEKLNLDLKEIRRSVLIVRQEIEFTLTRSVLGLGGFYLDPKYMGDQINFLQTIRDDPELHSFIQDDINRTLKRHQNSISNLKEWQKIFNK